MARLPSGRYLMQQTGGKAVLFEDYTEREIVRCDPGDQDDVLRAARSSSSANWVTRTSASPTSG